MASTTRFGRAVSSGNTASDSSCESRGSVSTADLYSCFAKPVRAVRVIKESSRVKFGRTILDTTGFVNCAGTWAGALKWLEKGRDCQGDRRFIGGLDPQRALSL